MHVTPVELVLAVVAVVIVFGPKSLPSFKRSGDTNIVDLSSLAPSQPAAGRAPSPLSKSVVPTTALHPQTQQPAQAPPQQQQYAMNGSAAPLKLPDEF